MVDRVLRITSDDGRMAVFCGDDERDRVELEAMVTELFGGRDQVVLSCSPPCPSS